MSFAITALRSAMLSARMSNAQYGAQANNQARLSAANNAPSFGGAKALNLDKSMTMKNAQASLEHTAANAEATSLKNLQKQNAKSFNYFA